MLAKHTMSPPPRVFLALAAAFILGASTGHCAEPGAPAAPLHVVTFNVRNSGARDGDDAWPRRSDQFFDTLAHLDPDLVGFQEVLADQHDAIVARLRGHEFAGVARNDGKRAGEWALLGFRKSRFAEVARGDFWLSETPEIAGSKSWDAALTRICSWMRLRDKTNGREFVFANTHFDHQGVTARQEASKLIARRVAVIAAGTPALLTGDLNINEDNPAYAVLVRPEASDAIRWIDAYRTVHPERRLDEASFHAFKGTVHGSRIDFIFHSEHFVARASEIVRTSRDGHYPSDHYPVSAIIEWR